MRSPSSCCWIVVPPITRASNDGVESIDESTTTPTGLNHKIFPSVSIFSSLVKNEPIPPIIVKVITTRTIAVSVLTVSYTHLTLPTNREV